MKHHRHFKLTPLLALLIAASAHAQLPTGMTVVNGQATTQQSGSQLTVTNVNNTILNWQSFSIGAANSVRFVQPSSTSQVLNRVTGNDPSAILGSLSSNGRVWLLNPNGVLFGQGARIDVASLVTSTLNIANNDWLAGRALFTGGGGAGSVVNQGEIRTANGGRVALIGSSVSNEGVISAPDGQIVLAAGQSVELVDTGAPNLAVKLTAPSGSALNLGSLSGSRVDLLAAAVNQQGVVEAQSIVLQADGRLTLASGSSTRADGEQGGNIKLLGQTIELQDGSVVSANGNSGGGTVLVGGGAQGQDASVPNAQGVYFAPGASITADALVNGDGGHIVLWADQATRAYGSLSAHAGTQGGNGGLIETSGHWLDAKPSHLDASAPAGKAGTWLLDPYDITISNASSDSGYDSVSFTANANNATINSTTLANALGQGINITVSTSGGGTQNGDITVNTADINVFSSSATTLTLDADRNITMTDANISNGYAALGIVLKAGKSGVGSVWIDDSYFSTNGGNVVVGGYGPGGAAVGLPGQPDGIKVTRSTINTGSGSVVMTGYTDQSGGRGVGFDQSVQPNSINAGSITLTGTSVNGTGVQVWAGMLSSTGAFNITGTGGTAAVNIAYNGANSPVELAAGSDLTITGTSTGDWNGVLIDESAGPSSGSMLTANGNLQIHGSNPAGSTVSGLYINAAPNSGILNSGGNSTLTATGGGMTLLNVGTTGTPSTFTANSDTSLLINGGSLGGIQVLLEAQNITLSGALQIFGAGAPDAAVIISGPNGTVPAQTFYNQAGPQVITLESSRYVIYMADATDSTSFSLGGLPYTYQRYGAVNGTSDWTGDSGDGIVSFATKTVSYTGTVTPRAYDGGFTANISNVQVVPGVSGDQQASPGVYTGTYGDKNAGTGKTVLLSIVQEPAVTDSTGHPVYGYDFGGVLTGDITKATLTGTVTANNKVYDATTAATLGVSGLTGFVGSETVNVNGTGSFADKNVGTGKAVNANYAITDGTNGGLAANYQFSPPANSPTANITPATISFTATGVNRVYDATINAAISNVSITPLGTDQLTVNTGLALFSDKNVGTAKTVFLSGFSLGGADAGNYTLQNPTNLSANVTPAPITFTATAQSKIYDGSTTTSLSNIAITPLGSDQLTLNNGSAAFVDKNAGTAKAVSTSGFSISGLDAGNYTLTAPTTLAADIRPAILTGTVTGTNKVYDGSTTATVNVTGVTGLVGSETVSVSGLGNFSDKNVGTAKPISATYQVANGSNGGLGSNYQFSPSSANSPTADITPATLTYTADAASLLTGVPLPSFTGTVSGFVGGDTQAGATTGSLAFNAGTSNTAVPGIYAINGGGLTATNYLFVQAAGNATALTIAGGGPAAQQAQSSAVPVNNVQPITPQPSNPQTTGVVDMNTTPVIVATPGGTPASFDSVPVSDMSPASLSNMLGARAGFMQQLLGKGLDQLAQNPGLADAVPCKSLKEASTGVCLVTEQLKLQARAEAGTSVPTPQQGPGAPGAVAAAPTAPVLAAAAAAPAPVLPLFSQRRVVKVAALPEIRRKVAVLIGEGQYQDASIPALSNSVGDAHAVAATLNEQLGYETLVLDNPSKEMVISTLNRLALETGPQDSVVVYYAGHGAQVDASGQGYWLMSNSDSQNAKTWLSNGDIGRLIQQIDARQVALISDSCYSGALVGGARIRATPGSVKPGELLAKRSTVVMSSGGNEPVFDSGRGGHSLFAWTLMDNLGKVKDWQLGGNVFERVRFAVARELPQRPQYGAAAGNAEGGDYLFEMRQLDAVSGSTPGAE